MESDLLAAILANPDDDAPRLVYADHLLERGDPRGELIAISCEADRLSPRDTRKYALQRRVDALLRAHPDLVEDRCFGVVRGFPTTLALQRVAELGRLHDVLRRIPLVALELFSIYPEDLVALLDHELGTIRALMLNTGDSMTVETAQRLAAWPALAQIRTLRLGRVEDGDGTAALLASPHLRGLERLHLTANGAASMPIEAIRDASFASTLDRLVLRSGRLRSHAYTLLATLPGLRRLVLDDTGSADALPRLAPILDRLVELHVTVSRIEDANVAMPGRLRSLTLESPDTLDEPSFLRLVRSPLARSLEALNCQGCSLSEVGIDAMRDAGMFGRLFQLGLYGEISAPAVERLATDPSVAGLRQLWLGGTSFDDRCARPLAMSPYLQELGTLVLHANLSKAVGEDLGAAFGERLRRHQLRAR